ncbi:Uncharacterised protein [Candidatus Venteria ishoeyi]|uniref:Uncharacterized protein n=1 Tax=Candidatus Venteria ishoeyi TaxID=1899563 RepID=A0A1H6FGJ3_9GAMM|nr:Uncharacterised protein [Candidatus Venteria ishoeyi]
MEVSLLNNDELLIMNKKMASIYHLSFTIHNLTWIFCQELGIGVSV